MTDRRSALADAFDPLRDSLRDEIEAHPEPDRAASAIRRALDRTFDAYRSEDGVDDDEARAAAQALELVKTTLPIVHQGVRAEAVWLEQPETPETPPERRDAALVLTGAAVLAIASAGLGSTLGLAAAAFFGAISARRLLPLGPLARLLRLAGRRTAKALPSAAVEARARLSPAGAVDVVANAVRLADRLTRALVPNRADPSTPEWVDDQELLGFLQALLEARAARDGDFAFDLLDRRLPKLLRNHGVEAIDYDGANRDLFDHLPALDIDGPRTSRPALIREGRLVLRGEVWTPAQSSGTSDES